VNKIKNNYWKIGELAKITGLTIRTLRYYDQVGLVSPSRSTDLVHRLYTKPDVCMLQQVIALKQMGLSLESIRERKESGTLGLDQTVQLQIDYLHENIRIKKELRIHLDAIFERMCSHNLVRPEQYLRVIELMMLDKNFSLPGYAK
jgi:MerR family transcriptional regulator, thiopeptide resistance regulator